MGGLQNPKNPQTSSGYSTKTIRYKWMRICMLRDNSLVHRVKARSFHLTRYKIAIKKFEISSGNLPVLAPTKVRVYLPQEILPQNSISNEFLIRKAGKH